MATVEVTCPSCGEKQVVRYGNVPDRSATSGTLEPMSSKGQQMTAGEASAAGERYRELYGNYYAAGARSTKRELSALESLLHIRRLVGNEHFAKVVDVGAGQGSLVELLSRQNFADHITAIELSASGLDAIAERKLPNVSIVPFNGYKSDFPDKAFDLALSIHVLEHVEHERLFLYEIKRIAKRAIIEVPLEHTMGFGRRVRVMDQYGHINHYTEETFLRLLATSGLKPLKMETNTYTLALDVFLSGQLKERSRTWFAAVRSKCGRPLQKACLSIFARFSASAVNGTVRSPTARG
jgi:Methylase involved in ubiquinone/menaquinone biosynthesis